MLNRRTQIMLDADRYERLQHRAAARRVSVAAVIRDAIDRELTDESDARNRAGEGLLTMEPFDLPGDEQIERLIADAHEKPLRATSPAPR